MRRRIVTERWWNGTVAGVEVVRPRGGEERLSVGDSSDSFSCSDVGVPTSRRPARRTRTYRRSLPTRCARRSPQRQRHEPQTRSRRQCSESRGSGIQLAGRMTAEPWLLHSVADRHCPAAPGHHKGRMSQPSSPRSGSTPHFVLDCPHISSHTTHPAGYGRVVLAALSGGQRRRAGSVWGLGSYWLSGRFARFR